uniref:Gliding motility-associated C-terminal domain-containing protein n=1 Tax=Roseihalotalea indica TaxID=2867963 RepID=A0AA49JGD4_9BACT|nr:gliding motility-associated C-terminal domain-containing protein [Tunicatimonas sp. TK19036]
MKRFLIIYISSLFFILLNVHESYAQSPGITPLAGENCNNGVDDDGDGLIDCKDGDCINAPSCILERTEGVVNGIPINCNDGIDNDGDGLADCNDPKCQTTCSGEICNDGIDNDGDGLIDCQDRDEISGCKASVFCENDCGDGIDNDGDGFYDYYDGDCLADPDNPNNYIVTQPDCEAFPVGNVFSIQTADSSANRTSAAFGMPMVADVDNDGTPEVITTNSDNGNIFVLNGADLSDIESQTDHGSTAYGYPTVGDVDGDGFGEIFVVDFNGRIKAYNHDLSNYWGTKTSAFTGNGRVLGLADFNLDGQAELYQVNEIRDATTGNVLIAGSHGTSKYPSANNWETELNAAPVAIDILPNGACTDCQGLELVVGHIIYSVDIAGGKLTEVLNMDNAATLAADYRSGGYHPKYAGWSGQTYSATSIADYNGDGFLDVVMGGTTGNQNGPTSVFFWDLQNDEVKMFIVSRLGSTINGGIKGNFRDLNNGGCGNSEQCTWMRGVGTLNIANIDNDPELEITFMSGSSLYALDQDMNLEWANHDQFWESSSGFTGTTVFDFDGDGASEIIYRDEINLYIVDGISGQIVSGLLDGSFCSSQTQGDYPIVADVDGDGETEIIVSCGQARNIYGSAPATNSTRINGHIKVYKAGGNNYWVPARGVWNQYAYFNVNINDDLSIPKIPQPHHLSMSQLCNNPSATATFSLNKFLNQSPRISYCGNLVFPAPKLDFVGDSTEITPPVCPEQEFQIRLYFENNGDEDVAKPIPISFYSDDPQKPYANTDADPHFSIEYLSIPGGLQPGEFIDTTLTITGPRGAYTLYASLNDVGPYDSLGNKIDNSTFYPLTKLNGTVRECDDTPTIVASDVNPFPFDVLAVKLRDNRNCPGALANSNNGEVQVFAGDSTVLQESDYDIIWTEISTGDVVGSNALVTELDSGIYEVIVTYNNGVYTCQGLADTVRVERFEDWPDTEVVSLETLQPVSSCAPGSADGQARVLLNGISPSDSDYSISWEEEQQGNSVAVGDTATNLQPIIYKVVVTNLLTGCSVSETIDMTLGLPEIRDLTIVGNTNCKNPNGSITVQMEGSVSDYDFMLIQQSPIQDTTYSNNPSFNKLDEGFYEVRAYDPTNDCGLYSSGEAFEIKTTKSIDDITIEVANDQTACSAPYNGQLTAVVADPTKYDWQWFRGTVTSGSLAVVVASDYFTPDTLSTNLTNVYTVVATDKGSGCTFSEAITLTEDVVIPQIDVSNVDILQHQTTCAPNGEVQISVGASNETAGYRFTLRQGSTIVDTNTTGLFTGLEAGRYNAIAENIATRCISTASAPFDILNQITPFGTIAFNETPQTNCNPANPNGALGVTVGGVTTGYQFKWFVGVDTSTVYPTQPVPGHTLSGIEAGNYVVRIYNNATGCITVAYHTLADESADYQETVTASVIEDQIYCTPGVFSGQIEAGLLASASGPAPDTANYTYYWYEGTKTNVRNGSAILISGQNQSVINGLDVGWYSVRAVRNDGFGCAALDTAEVFVDDMRDFPVAGINIDVVEQTSCDSNNENGGLRGDINGNTTGYVFNWYELDNGVDIPITDNNPNAVINGFSVDNLGEGTYILEVENIETGCTGRQQVNLYDNIIRGDDILLTLGATDATNCSPANGVAEVTSIEITEDGGATYTPDNISNYTFQWYRGDDMTDPILLSENAAAQSPQLTGVEPGQYTVLATSNNSTCPSVPYTITVSSGFINNLTFTIIEDKQNDCINPDGGLEVTAVTGGSGSYSYQWYKGATLDYPLSGETLPRIEQIRSDKYTIVITDDNTGCSVDTTLTVGSDVTPVPPPSLSVIDVTTCDPSLYNGQVTGEVDPTILSTIPKYSLNGYGQDDFFYYWFEGKLEDGAVKYIDPSGDLDDPNNYLTLNNDSPTLTPFDNKRIISNLAPGWYTVIIVDAKQYIASGGVDPFECQSDARSFEVKAIAQSPVVTETSNTPNSFCEDSNGETVLEVSKKADDTTPYGEYRIIDATLNGVTYPIPGADSTSTHIAGISTFTVGRLASGTYEFTLQDATTKCNTIVEVEIQNVLDPPNLLSADVEVVADQTSCNPINGIVRVKNPPSNVGVMADYEFLWFDDLAKYNSATSDRDADFVGDTWASRPAGRYYVFAINKTTGCISSYQMLEIKEDITETQVTISSISNTDCSGANEGTLTAEAEELQTDGTISTPGAGYRFEWYDDSNNLIHTDNGLLTSTITNLTSAPYRVEVRNLDLDCETVTARDTVDFEPVYPEFTAASADPTHVKTCDGDGRIEITEIFEDGSVIQSTDAAFSNYSFDWYQGDPTIPANQLPGNTNVQTDLLVDTYYIFVTNTSAGSNCRSINPLQVVLVDSIEYPLIYGAVDEHFTECTGVNEGEISVSIEELDGTVPATGYNIEWFEESSTVAFQTDPNATASTVSNLIAGDYKVVAVNNETGCRSDTARFTVNSIVAKPILTASKIADQTNCDPINGAAQVDNLTFLGVASPTSGYDFVWTEDDFATSISTGTYGLDANGETANSLPAGTYLIKAVNSTTGCESLPVQIVIEDSTQSLIVLLDNISDPIVACNPADDPEGSIEVEVLNSTDIITRWYAGAVITDPADSIVGFSNSLEIEDVVPGTYSVWVQDILSGCTTTRTYTIEGVAVPLTISTSATPVFSCITPNGQMAANVNGGSGNYRYRWIDSQGNVVTTSDNANLVTGMNSGTYTVQVSDRNEPDCATVEAEVTIQDTRGNDIVVEVTPDFPVTNCDVSNPNGQLSATVSGDLSRYDFFWYAGESTDGNPVAQGPTATELSPSTYSVVARDKVTGCLSDPFTTTVAAELDQQQLPVPLTELVSPVTRCTFPDGSALAVLDSALLDSTAVYEYAWYNENGREVFKSTRTNIVRELPVGDYFVRVTNLVTGCYSESEEITIPENIRPHDFEIVTTPSTCLEATGSVQVVFHENFKVVDIEWLTPNGYASHFFLKDQPPGLYEVTVTDDKGCKFTQTAQIESTIYTYNGISPNGDGNNDKFIISCIEDFVNNRVRIYNRAGTLVYENMNYDNNTSFFEGYGNRGLYIGGEKLPDGTYFYIIDKNNGDDPESGYLELIR